MLRKILKKKNNCLSKCHDHRKNKQKIKKHIFVKHVKHLKSIK